MIAPPPLVYVIGLAAGLGLEALLPSPDVPRFVAWPLGGALLTAGLCLGPWFLLTFWRAPTPVNAYKPTSALVTTGPFRLSRNPGYVSLTLMYGGVALLANAPWAFPTLVPVLFVIERGVIKREERYLERRFGGEYLRYKARTRRWI